MDYQKLQNGATFEELHWKVWKGAYQPHGAGCRDIGRGFALWLIERNQAAAACGWPLPGFPTVRRDAVQLDFQRHGGGGS